MKRLPGPVCKVKGEVSARHQNGGRRTEHGELGKWRDGGVGFGGSEKVYVFRGRSATHHTPTNTGPRRCLRYLKSFQLTGASSGSNSCLATAPEISARSRAHPSLHMTRRAHARCPILDPPCPP